MRVLLSRLGVIQLRGEVVHTAAQAFVIQVFFDDLHL